MSLDIYRSTEVRKSFNNVKKIKIEHLELSWSINSTSPLY